MNSDEKWHYIIFKSETNFEHIIQSSIFNRFQFPWCTLTAITTTKILTQRKRSKSKPDNSSSWLKLRSATFGPRIFKKKWKNSSNSSKDIPSSPWYSFPSHTGHIIPRYHRNSRRIIRPTLLQRIRRVIHSYPSKCRRNQNDSNRSFNRRLKRKRTLPCQHMAVQLQVG